MTKEEALAEFKRLYPHETFLRDFGYDGRCRMELDDFARREAWNDYIDTLCKEGRITRHQYETWHNPF